MRITKRQLRKILKEAILREGGYEGRYFDQHGTGTFYSPDEQFREEVHFILDESPSETSYWERVYPLIETLDEDERYMAEKIASDMWERHTRPHDYRWGY